MLTSDSERSFSGSANSLPCCSDVWELPRAVAFLYFREMVQINTLTNQGTTETRWPLLEHPSSFTASGKHNPMVIVVAYAFCQGDNCENWVASHQVQLLLWRKFETSMYPILQ